MYIYIFCYYYYLIIVLKKSITDLEDELDQLKRMHNKDTIDLQTQRYNIVILYIN